VNIVCIFCEIEMNGHGYFFVLYKSKDESVVTIELIKFTLIIDTAKILNRDEIEMAERLI